MDVEERKAELKAKIPYEGISWMYLTHEQRVERARWWDSAEGCELKALSKGKNFVGPVKWKPTLHMPGTR